MSDFAAVLIHSKTISIFSSRPIISRKRWTDADWSSLLTAATIVVGLIALDELLHRHRITVSVAVAHDGIGAAAGLDEHVREEDAGVDLHRRNVRHVDRFLLLADPSRCVLDDARRRDL